MDKFRFVDFLENYPPVIPRAKVSKYFPWLSPKRLAALDSLGQGPAQAFKNGRAVLYPTKAFLEWLDNRTRPYGRPQKQVKPDSHLPHKKNKLGTPKRRGRKTKQQEVREREGKQ